MQTVESWQDIIDNLREFSRITEQNSTEASNRFSNFYHWYYFPDDDMFAPGKFIGYKGTKILNYTGEGDGGETQDALLKYFDKIPENSQYFEFLYSKLKELATSVGKVINKRTSAGNGGIYTPKEQFLSIEKSYFSQLLVISTDDINAYKEEDNLSGFEGEKKSRLVNIYERDPSLRATAIKIHGTICKVCGFNFEQEYGAHGKDYIEVHHIKPLHKLIEPSLINPVTDMTVLCSNCHRMVHRKLDDILTVEQLRKLRSEAGGKL